MAFGEEIKHKTKFKLAGNFQFKLIVTILSLLIGGWATVRKENKSSDEFHNFQFETAKENRLRDSANSENLRKRDLAHNANDVSLEKKYTIDLEENDNKNLRVYTEALAKYHLKYIESQNKIASMVRDSIDKEIPSFGIQHTIDAVSFKINQRVDSIIGNISYQNFGNCPILVTLDIYIVSQKDNILKIMPFKIRAIQNSLYSINQPLNYPLFLYGFKGKYPDVIWILSKGFCKTTDGRKTSPIDDLIEWDFQSETWGGPMVASQDKKIRAFIDSSGIK